MKKPKGNTSTTRGVTSRLITLRLPYALEELLVAEAKAKNMPWQTLLKQILAEGLGLTSSSLVEVKRVSADSLKRSTKKLSTPT